MGKPHAVVFPIPLQGHINPMMLLAKHLNSAGIRVTFILTERTLSILQHNHNSSKYDNSTSCDVEHNHCGRAAAVGILPRDDEHNRCGRAEGGILPDNNNKHKNKSTTTNDEDDGHNNYNKKHNSKKNTHHHKDDSVKDEADVDDDAEDGAVDNHCSKHNNSTANFDGDGVNNYDIHNGDIKNSAIHGDDDVSGGGYVDVCDVDDVPPIQFETLPDSSSSHDHSLPMSSYVLTFLNSMPLLKQKLGEILESLQQKGHPATCIISDSFVPWTQDVANTFGIPRMEFWSSSVTIYAMGYHIPQLISKGYLPVHPGADQEFSVDIIPGLAPFRLSDFFCIHAISSPVFDLISKAFSRAREAQRVLVNSFYDLEKDIINALQAEGVSIDPIGPLLPSQIGAGSRAMLHLHSGIAAPDKKVMSTSLYVDDDDCLTWLDTQAESSVIYVSFGSMASISKEEMEELMLGLESSQQPYLLVLRPGMVSGGCARISARGNGRICGWAPQMQVLGHPAVGGFLTHCGWNSIMEGMYMGVPMIGCARESEQHTNMKCLRDEWKVAIGLDDNVCDRKKEATRKLEMKKELVERAVRAVMQEEEGVALRKRMQGFQEAAKCAAHHSSSLPLLIHHIKHSTDID